MRNREKYLPIILSLLIPGMNIVNQKIPDEGLNWFKVIPPYLFGALFLFSLWHYNRFIPNLKEKLNVHWLRPVPSRVVFNLAFILPILTMIIAFVPLAKLPFYDFSYVFIAFRLGLASVVFIFIQQALDALEQREAFRIQNLSLQAENLKSQMEAMKQQINPHFLFNSLNSLLDLIEEEPGKAPEFVRSFSNLYRVVLQSSQQDFVQLADELKFLQDYWKLIKLRFNSAVDLKISIPDRHMGDWIPPLSLQLLVENAVKHNLATPAKPLRINIESSGDHLIVSNPIHRKDFEVKGEGVGLSNLQIRYQLLHQPIAYGEQDGLFTVKLPLKTV